MCRVRQATTGPFLLKRCERVAGHTARPLLIGKDGLRIMSWLALESIKREARRAKHLVCASSPENQPRSLRSHVDCKREYKRQKTMKSLGSGGKRKHPSSY